MDLKERFERRVSEAAVAEVLTLLSTRPNSRDRPIPGDLDGPFDFWFDGGSARIQTGWVEYALTDGTRVTVGAPVPALSIVIDFPNGCRVRVQQESW